MVAESALVVVQVRVVVSPALIGFGEAAMVTVGLWITVTVALAVAVPPGPWAVIAYVVVLAGETVIEPFIGIVPMPLSREAESAWSDDQVSVDVSPSIMVCG
jgi:hypothetical protein